MEDNKEKEDKFLKKFINNLNTNNDKNFYSKIVNKLQYNRENNIEIGLENNKIDETINNIKNISAKSLYIIIDPISNNNIELFIDKVFDFIKGNMVLIESENLLNKFEATVDYYDSDIGLLKLSNIKNIVGTFHNYSVYIVTLKVNNYKTHYTLTGPEQALYFRGKSEIINNNFITVKLPNYLSNVAYDFTVSITPIYKKDNDNNNNESLFVSEVENNEFTVYGKSRKFFWIVYGKNI
jgi:hypothetical protein